MLLLYGRDINYNGLQQNNEKILYNKNDVSTFGFLWNIFKEDYDGIVCSAFIGASGITNLIYILIAMLCICFIINFTDNFFTFPDRLTEVSCYGDIFINKKYMLSKNFPGEYASIIAKMKEKNDTRSINDISFLEIQKKYLGSEFSKNIFDVVNSIEKSKEDDYVYEKPKGVFFKNEKIENLYKELVSMEEVTPILKHYSDPGCQKAFRHLASIRRAMEIPNFLFCANINSELVAFNRVLRKEIENLEAPLQLLRNEFGKEIFPCTDLLDYSKLDYNKMRDLLGKSTLLDTSTDHKFKRKDSQLFASYTVKQIEKVYGILNTICYYDQLKLILIEIANFLHNEKNYDEVKKSVRAFAGPGIPYHNLEDLQIQTLDRVTNDLHMNDELGFMTKIEELMKLKSDIPNKIVEEDENIKRCNNKIENLAKDKVNLDHQCEKKEREIIQMEEYVRKKREVDPYYTIDDLDKLKRELADLKTQFYNNQNETSTTNNEISNIESRKEKWEKLRQYSSLDDFKPKPKNVDEFKKNYEICKKSIGDLESRELSKDDKSLDERKKYPYIMTYLDKYYKGSTSIDDNLNKEIDNIGSSVDEALKKAGDKKEPYEISKNMYHEIYDFDGNHEIKTWKNKLLRPIRYVFEEISLFVSTIINSFRKNEDIYFTGREIYDRYIIFIHSNPYRDPESDLKSNKCYNLYENSMLNITINVCLLTGIILTCQFLLLQISKSFGYISANKLNNKGYIELLNIVKRVNKNYYLSLGGERIKNLSMEYLQQLPVIYSYLVNMFGTICLLFAVPILLRYMAYITFNSKVKNKTLYNLLQKDNLLNVYSDIKDTNSIADIFAYNGYDYIIFVVQSILIILNIYLTYINYPEEDYDKRLQKLEGLLEDESQEETKEYVFRIKTNNLINFLLIFIFIIQVINCSGSLAHFDPGRIEANDSLIKLFYARYSSDLIERLKSPVHIYDERKNKYFKISILLCCAALCLVFFSVNFMDHFSRLYGNLDEFIRTSKYSSYLSERFGNLMVDKVDKNKLNIQDLSFYGMSISCTKGFSYSSIEFDSSGEVSNIKEGVEVLSRVDLDTLKAHYITIVGKTGGGKSTLLQILRGADIFLLKSPEVHIPVVKFSAEDQWHKPHFVNQRCVDQQELLDKILYIPQQVRMAQHYTIEKIYHIFYDGLNNIVKKQKDYQVHYLINNIEDKQIVKRALYIDRPINHKKQMEQVLTMGQLYPEITDFSRILGYLSGGQQQRLYISMIYLRLLISCSKKNMDSRGLVSNGPSFIFADEFYIGLNGQNRKILYEYYFRKLPITIYNSRLQEYRRLNNDVLMVNNSSSPLHEDSWQYNYNLQDDDLVYEDLWNVRSLIVTHIVSELQDRKIDKVWYMDTSTKTFEEFQLNDYLSQT